jgi:Big-like domain-containing protein
MSNYGQGSKPLWDTEANWTTVGGYTDNNARAGFLARYYLLHWSRGVSRFYWYAWDNSGWGQLWSSTGGVQPAGIAYREVGNWLTGSTMTNACSSSNGIWTCEITKSGGYQGLIVWNPAGSSSYTPPTQYTDYRTILGATGTVGTTITISPLPILLEAVIAAPVTVTVSSPLNGASYSSTSVHFVASASASIGISSIAVYVDNTMVKSITGSSLDAYVTAAAGSHSYSVQAWDTAGNVGKSTGTFSVTATTSPAPTLTVLKPLNGQTVSSPTTFAATASSPVGVASILLYIDNKLMKTVYASSINVSLTLPNGKHSYVFKTWDTTGQMTQAGGTISVFSPVKLTVWSPINGGTTGTSVHFSAAASSSAGVSSIMVYVDSHLLKTVYSDTVDFWTTVATGQHSYAVYAWDNSGKSTKQTGTMYVQ